MHDALAAHRWQRKPKQIHVKALDGHCFVLSLDGSPAGCAVSRIESLAGPSSAAAVDCFLCKAATAGGWLLTSRDL